MLPKIHDTKYELKLTGLNKTIHYRPFKVKEQKLLLEAKQSESEDQMVQAVYAIITNCTFGGVNPAKLATFDVEELFLRIRAKSVGELIELKYNFTYDEGDKKVTKPVSLNINIDDVKVKTNDDHTNILEFKEDGFSLEMQYPTFEMITKIKNEDDIIESCIKSIIHGDEVYQSSDLEENELRVWLDDLEARHLESIQQFFSTMPSISHEETIELPNGKSKTIKLKGLNDFF